MARHLLMRGAMRVLVLFVCVAACSDSGGSVSGQPPGGTFDVADMISATVTTSDSAGDSSSSARILLGSTPNLCDDAAASPAVDRKGAHLISIDLREVAGATRTAPTAAGTFTIYPDTGTEPAKAASLSIDMLDAACQTIDADSASAQSGSVTLTTVAAGVYTGSFDVTLNTGGHLSGTFAPTTCPQLATANASTAPHACS